MLETEYRASRFCRVMGNPTAYQIVRCLLKKKRSSPSEMANEIGLSLQTTCDTLRNLRNIDVVRYETLSKNKISFLKDDKIIDILDDLEKFVRRLRVKKW